MTDPIADMLTRIRNAQNIKSTDVLIPHSKVKLELGKILQNEGYVKEVEVVEKDNHKHIKIALKYQNEEPAIKMIKRVSSPGKRIYKDKDNLPWVMQSTGIAIISTSQGLMTDRQARAKGVGGEVMCKVW